MSHPWLQGVASCEAGALLSDSAVCEIVHACFRICSQPSLSELLRHSAETALRTIVDNIFARLAHLPMESFTIPEGTTAEAAMPSPSRPKVQGGAAAPEAGAAAKGVYPPPAGEMVESAAIRHAADDESAAAAAAAAADATAQAPSGHRTADTADADAGAASSGGASGSAASGAVGAAAAGGGSEATAGVRDDDTGGEGGAGVGPYGGACLFEVVGFFLTLIDGSNASASREASVRGTE